MSTLSTLRRLVQSVGLDVTRFPAGTPAYRRARLLAHHDISVVFDVGANEGMYVLELRRFGYKGRAVSFEPAREALRRLRDHAISDPRWDVLSYAIGAESGEVTLNVAGNDGASSSILPMLSTHLAAAPRSAFVAQETVTQHPLDGLWRNLASPEDGIFLKIDVQGYEGQVIEGARDLLAHCRGVQLEVSFVPLYQDAFTFEQAVAFARQHGFVIAGVEPGFTDQETGQVYQADFILFRDY